MRLITIPFFPSPVPFLFSCACIFPDERSRKFPFFSPWSLLFFPFFERKAALAENSSPNGPPFFPSSSRHSSELEPVPPSLFGVSGKWRLPFLFSPPLYPRKNNPVPGRPVSSGRSFPPTTASLVPSVSDLGELYLPPFLPFPPPPFFFLGRGGIASNLSAPPKPKRCVSFFSPITSRPASFLSPLCVLYRGERIFWQVQTVFSRQHHLLLFPGPWWIYRDLGLLEVG